MAGIICGSRDSRCSLCLHIVQPFKTFAGCFEPTTKNEAVHFLFNVATPSGGNLKTLS